MWAEYFYLNQTPQCLKKNLNSESFDPTELFFWWLVLRNYNSKNKLMMDAA